MCAKETDVNDFARQLREKMENLGRPPRTAFGEISSNVVNNLCAGQVKKDAAKEQVSRELTKNPQRRLEYSAERYRPENWVRDIPDKVDANDDLGRRHLVPTGTNAQNHRQGQEQGLNNDETSQGSQVQINQKNKECDNPKSSVQEKLFSGVPYQDDILKYLMSREVLLMPRKNYMEMQPHLSYTKRKKLVDWLVEVAAYYELCQSSFFLAVYIVDKFLSTMSVVQEKLQLLGSAAMFIASKIEECRSMEVADVVYSTDGAYTREEILKMEILIVSTLDCNFSVPTVNTFINLIGSYKVAPGEVLTLAMFLCELTLMEAETYLSHPPSLVASGALALAYNCRYDRVVVWPIAVARLTGYTLKPLTKVIEALNETHSKCFSSPYQAIVSKYSSSKYHFVSKVPHVKLTVPRWCK